MIHVFKGFHCLLLYEVLAMIMLVGCRSGSNGEGSGTESSTLVVDDYHFAEVTGTETPIAATITDKNGTEMLSIMAEKDASGNPIKITGAAYTSKEGYSGIIEVGTDGLPVTLTDSSGSKATFTNYTGTTVDIAVYDSTGKLVVGPVTTNIDAGKIQEIKELFGSISLVATSSKGGLRSSKIFRETSGWAKWGGTVWSVAGCAMATYMIGGIAIFPCGSALLGILAKFTENDLDNAVSLTVSSSKCLICSTSLTSALTDLPCVMSCMSVLTNVIAGNYIVEPVDAAAPSVPTGLAASSISLDQIDLSWSAPPESDLAGYKIYRDGTYLKFVAVTSASDTGLSYSTRYCYTVSAYDAAWNESKPSGQVCATTQVSAIPPDGVTSTSSWPMFGHDAQHTCRSPYTAVQATSSNLKWTLSGIGDVVNNKAFKADITIDSNGVIYAYSNYSYNKVLDAISPTGSIKWTYQAKDTYGYKMLYAPPTIGNDGTIYIGDEAGYIHAINNNGTLKWKKNYFVNSNWLDAPMTIADDGTIYAVGCDCITTNSLIAINPDGTKRWSYKPSDTNVESLSPAIRADGTFYIGVGNNGSGTGGLTALNPDGSYKWSYLTGVSPLLAPAVGLYGTVYIGDYYYLHAVNPDGTLKWKLSRNGYYSVSTLSIATDGTIYLLDSGKLYALDPSNGNSKWQLNIDSITDGLPSVTIDVNGIIYVGTTDYLYAINPDGIVKWSYYGYYYFGVPHIGSDGSLYVSTADGLRKYGP